MVEILPAASSQLEEIYLLICELEGTPVSRKGFSACYRQNLENPQVHYFVAQEGGRVLGFISLHIQQLLHHAAKVAEIQELVVCGQLRGQGIGKLLFAAAKEAAVREGCLQLEVCCNRSRVMSHTFYLRQGMTNRHFKFCLPLRETNG